MELNTPYVEYSDKNGKKTKLELGIDIKRSVIRKFYTDYIEQHDINE
tara:strand:+ start:301 stop:441 length:141 start_codon:yes stop_codon:yes gene_type:complete